MKFNDLQDFVCDTLADLFWPITKKYDMDFAFHTEKIPHNGLQLDVYALIDDSSSPRGYQYKSIDYSLKVYAIAGKEAITRTLSKKMDSLQLLVSA